MVLIHKIRIFRHHQVGLIKISSLHVTVYYFDCCPIMINELFSICFHLLKVFSYRGSHRSDIESITPPAHISFVVDKWNYSFPTDTTVWLSWVAGFVMLVVLLLLTVWILASVVRPLESPIC